MSPYVLKNIKQAGVGSICQLSAMIRILDPIGNEEAVSQVFSRRRRHLILYRAIDMRFEWRVFFLTSQRHGQSACIESRDRVSAC